MFSRCPAKCIGLFVVQVTAQQDTSDWAKAGIMLRETAAADSRFVLLAVTPGHGVTFQVRSATHVVPSYTTVGGGLGDYLRLVRTGSTFTAAVSTDGTSWKAVGTASVPMGNTVEAGLAVTAHDNAAVGTATFEHLDIPTTTTAASNWSVGTPDYLQRWESDTATVGGKVYVFGGYVNRQLIATTESDAYTPATNTWAHLAAEPYAVTHAGTVAVGTTIYLAGGYLGQQTGNPPITNVVQAYDTATNPVGHAPVAPGPGRGRGIGVRERVALLLRRHQRRPRHRLGQNVGPEPGRHGRRLGSPRRTCPMPATTSGTRPSTA